jgi:hypothetical protein
MDRVYSLIDLSNMAGFSPKTERDLIEILTGIFEGGSYCTLAEDPKDTQGGLSYGKHQASELQGGLVALLKMYVARSTPPLPNPGFLSQIRAELQLYGPTGRKYLGSATQRAAYKQLLTTVCNDPAMQRAQDDFFDQSYFVPAMQHASDFGIKTPLGQSIFYDISIQAGSARTSFYRAALSQWNAQHPGATATCCSPKDPHGPDEKSFLLAVNAARRSEMLQSALPAYRATVYRPDEYDKLLNDDNLFFKKNFVFRGVAIQALP